MQELKGTTSPIDTILKTKIVKSSGKKAFDFRVIAGEFSDKTKMGYTWRAVNYTSNSLTF